ncbi:MAG: DPP IV N-terminal domain-containing protein [Cyclobacteriaceae bacterium]|nr:DPP IV N-terminal domain-containing protein [Cyclobacteriaceae bacterium]
MKRVLLLAGLLVTSVLGFAQKQITVEDIYGKGTFRSRSVYGINWMNDGRYYSALRGNAIVKFDVTSGEEVETILDGNTLNPGIQIASYEFNADERYIVLLTDRESIYRRSYTAIFYLYDRDTKTLRKLDDDRIAYATVSPDGTKVAYTKDNNLYYVNLADMSRVQVTSDGEKNSIINGSTDWVYEEELSFTKAFFWSPDSKKLAYYRFDETEVPEYTLQYWNHGQLYPENYTYKYPKAGEKNSEVQILVYHLDSRKKVNVDIGNEKDIYIPRMNWTYDPNVLSVRRMNRLQNKLDILHANADTGATKLIIQEKSDTYVDVELTDDLTYLKDGKHILLSSERDGYKHFYLYTIDGQLVRQITKGNWEVASFVGVDQNSKTPIIYYTSKEESPLQTYFYSIDLNGKNKRKLSTHTGVNRVNMSNDFQYYINYFSNSTTPNTVELYATRGNKMIKVLEDNARLKEAAKEYGLVDKEFYTFTNETGDVLNGYMLKPRDFDPNKKYPVLMFQYSGPGSQNVTDSWGGSNYYWHQMLVQKGIIVSVVDGRGTGGRGAEFKKQTYKKLGRLEVEDQIASANYLASLPYVDGSRIGIWGWSFGGYMSSLAMMEGADVFAMGIAVAPVTSWRYYDTIYTERFLSTPQLNPEGYDDNSPTTVADKLKGKFLLIHGTGDDNVHFENAVALQDKLISEGKQFSSFYYPDRAHGIYKDNARVHLFTMMTNFVLDNLQQPQYPHLINK